MDETRKSAYFPTPVRWFEVPMDGMKRGFNYLKKRVDQLIDLDQTRNGSDKSESKPDAVEGSIGRHPRPPSNRSVGTHLNTYA